LDGLKAYLPEGYDEEVASSDRGSRGMYVPNVLVSWMEPQNNDVDLEALSEEVHIQCTKCKFCEGERNTIAIKNNEPILLCELKGCNREYHLKCLPQTLTRGRAGSNVVVDGSHDHIVYFDKEAEEGGVEEGVPPGDIYCKECVSEGSTTVLQQYFTRCEEIRKHYASSRDYVLSLLERHMMDNPAGNIVDGQGGPVSPEEEVVEEVHLKPPPRSELWYVEEMNEMARVNPFEKDGGASSNVPDETKDEEKDFWSAAEFLIGKPVRLYCNLDNEYHNGRIVDWRTCSVYPNTKTEKLHRSQKSVHVSKLDFYGAGPLSCCEFLVHFPAGDGKRKKEVSQWMILEEHSLAVGITLVRGQYDIKSHSPEKWRPAMVLARSALELVPVREFLQEGAGGELFGQKKLEEAESGISATDDLLALTSFFGSKDHEVLNLRSEMKGLITWDLLEKYHVKEDLEAPESEKPGKKGDASPTGVVAVEPEPAVTTKRIPVPPKMAMALTEYKDQCHCKKEYEALSNDFSGSLGLISGKNELKVKEENAADVMEIDRVEENKPHSPSDEQSKEGLVNAKNEADSATSQQPNPSYSLSEVEHKEGPVGVESNPNPATSHQPAADDDMFEATANEVTNSNEETEQNAKTCSEDANTVSEKPANAEMREGSAGNMETQSSMEVETINFSSGKSIFVVDNMQSTEETSPKPCDGTDDIKIVSDEQQREVEGNKNDDESSLGIDIEEECGEDIYADYDVVEIYEDDDTVTTDDNMSIDSGFDSTDSYSQPGKGIKGLQTGKLGSGNVRKGQTVIGGKRVRVDVVRTGHRGRPRHANVSPESKNASHVEEVESRKRPPPQSRPEPQVKYPRPEAKKPPYKPPAPKPLPVSKPLPAAKPPVPKPTVSKPKPAPKPKDDSSSDEEDNANPISSNLMADLPRGITMRPSGKWQAQLYYAGKSRYLGVFKNKRHALRAYEVARTYLIDDPDAAKATQHSDVNFHISRARKAAQEALKK
jgi:hypothetical protein